MITTCLNGKSVTDYNNYNLGVLLLAHDSFHHQTSNESIIQDCPRKIQMMLMHKVLDISKQMSNAVNFMKGHRKRDNLFCSFILLAKYYLQSLLFTCLSIKIK